MKALKTIVATAVIVFALTTVAMAGAQRLGGTDRTAGPAAAAPAVTALQTQARATVTLTARQFAQLVRFASGRTARRQAASRDRDRDRSRSGNAGVRSYGSAAFGAVTAATHSYNCDHTWSQTSSADGHDSGEHHSGDQGEGCE